MNSVKLFQLILNITETKGEEYVEEEDMMMSQNIIIIRVQSNYKYNLCRDHNNKK